MKQVSILGLGLMGGSLGLAIKQRMPGVRVHGYARATRTRTEAQRRNAVDSAFDNPADAVAQSDLVVICTPVLTMPDVLRASLPHLKSNVIVTDVGSTKSTVMQAMAEVLRGTTASLVGSHPIAGSEETGIDVARPNLYENAVTIVSPFPGRPPEATTAVEKFWRQLGAQVIQMDAARHDLLLAKTSHLPHLVAALLVQTVMQDQALNPGPFCGPGFRDSTRIAAGSEQMWHDIVKTNAHAIQTELEAFRNHLDGLIDMIQQGNMDGVREWLLTNRIARQSLEPAQAEE